MPRHKHDASRFSVASHETLQCSSFLVLSNRSPCFPFCFLFLFFRRSCPSRFAVVGSAVASPFLPIFRPAYPGGSECENLLLASTGPWHASPSLDRERSPGGSASEGTEVGKVGLTLFAQYRLQRRFNVDGCLFCMATAAPQCFSPTERR